MSLHADAHPVTRVAFGTCLALLVATAQAIPWPVAPTDSIRPIGHTWGNYLSFGGQGQFHPAVDVMASPGTPVVAVAPGWVKAWGSTGGREFHYLAVSDSDMECAGRSGGWMYTHIDPDLPHAGLADEVAAGDTVGFVVRWQVVGFDHVHFGRISDTGLTWQRFPGFTWWAIENPLLQMAPMDDTVTPAFEDARPGRRFAFCQDNASVYLDPDSLAGEVDIIARLYDETGCRSGTAWDRVAPYQVEYCIREPGGRVVVPWTISVQFSNRLDRANTHVVYKNDFVCTSRADYTVRDYFFIVTNTDGDTVIEAGDRDGNWATTGVEDGEYIVLVRAGDAVGNTAIDSMMVTVRNAGGLKQGPGVMPEFAPLLRVTAVPGRLLVRCRAHGVARCDLVIVDASGSVVERRPLEGGRGEQQFVSRRLPAGVYLVRLETGTGRVECRSAIVIR